MGFRTQQSRQKQALRLMSFQSTNPARTFVTNRQSVNRNLMKLSILAKKKERKKTQLAGSFSEMP